MLLIVILAIAVVSKAVASSVAGTETLVGIVGKDFVLLGADSSVSQSISLTASNLDKIAVLVDPLVPHRGPSEQQTIVAAAAGDAADSDRILGTLALHARYREWEASVGCDVDFVACTTTKSPPRTPAGLTVDAVAHFARHQIATQLRSATPKQVCLLVAGMSPVLASSTRDFSSKFAAEQVQMQVAQADSSSKPRSKQSTEPPSELVAAKRHVLEPRLFWLDEYGSMQRLHYGAHGFGSNFIVSILDQGYRPDLTREEAVVLMKDCFAQLRMRYVINSPQPYV